MSWILDNSLDQINHELINDPSTDGRWTFRRKMRFYPPQYQDWKKGLNVSGASFLTELIDDNRIPKKGDEISGIGMSGFYVAQIQSIKSMTDNQNLDPYSYAQVTILYQNKQPANSSGAYSSKKPKKPWEELVQDFLFVNVPQEVPFFDISGYLPKTTAGQPFYDVNTTEWYQRITWTHNDRNKDYSATAAVINENQITLMDKITLAPQTALLLPPGYKRLYYTDKQGQQQPYDQWTFQIIVKRKGFDKILKNAGTKFISTLSGLSGQPYTGLVDICTWYVAGKTPSGVLFDKQYGNYQEMTNRKIQIDKYNKNLPNAAYRLQFSGDIVNTPIPIDIGGGIDYIALNNPTQTINLYFQQYRYVNNFNIGLRWKENQSGNY